MCAKRINENAPWTLRVRGLVLPSEQLFLVLRKLLFVMTLLIVTLQQDIERHADSSV